MQTSFAEEKNDEKLISVIGVEKFLDNIGKLKKVKSIADVSSLDYELRYFFKHIKPWYYFDHDEFRKQFLDKLKESFNSSEFKILIETFSKPFMVKVLNNSVLYRDIFSFNQNSVDESYKVAELVKSRYTLIQNIYIMHGMEIQKEYMLERLKETLKAGKPLVNVLRGDKVERVFVDPVELEKRIKDPRDFIIRDFATDLKNFRHYELREYLRILKGDKLSQKFVQLYANFHFLYMSKYINKVETDKLNQLKAI